MKMLPRIFKWRRLLCLLQLLLLLLLLLLPLQLQLQLEIQLQLQLQTGKLVERGCKGGGGGSCVRRQICVATRQNCKTSTSNSSQVLSMPGTTSAPLFPFLSHSLLPLLLFLLLFAGYYKFAISLLPFLQPSLMSFLCRLLAASL